MIVSETKSLPQETINDLEMTDISIQVYNIKIVYPLEVS